MELPYQIQATAVAQAFLAGREISVVSIIALFLRPNVPLRVITHEILELSRFYLFCVIFYFTHKEQSYIHNFACKT
jgi:hypothetical protein